MTPRKKPTAAEESADVSKPETVSASDSADIDRILAFHLDTQRYAFPIDQVQEIQQIVAFADMPDKNGVVLGMVNLRGRVIPAVDLRILLGMPRKEYGLETPMVICRIGEGLVAIVVDGVDDVIQITKGSIQAAPRMHSLASRMVGVCHLENEMVFVLDVELLTEPVDLSHHEEGEIR